MRLREEKEAEEKRVREKTEEMKRKSADLKRMEEEASIKVRFVVWGWGLPFD